MAPAYACDPLRGFAPQPLHPLTQTASISVEFVYSLYDSGFSVFFSHFFNFIAFFTIPSLINLYAKQLFIRTHRCGNAGNQPPRRSGYQAGRPPEPAERRRFQIIFFERHKGINLPAESFYLCCNRVTSHKK